MRGMLMLYVGLALVAETSPQKVEFKAKDLKLCEQSRDNPDQALQPCTRLIGAFEGVPVKVGLDAEILKSAYFHRANAYASKGDYDRAIRDYDRVILMDPNYAAAFHNRALLYSDKGEQDRAIRDLDQVIRIDPTDAKAFRMRGWTYWDKENFDLAIRDFDQAIRLKPDNADAFYGRGTAHDSTEEFDLAIQDFDQAIQLKPAFHQAVGNRGNAYRDMGEYDRAIQDYDQAIRIKPDYALAFYNRGLARFLTGQFGAAATDFATVAQLAPRNRYYFLWLCAARARAGQSGKAPLAGQQQLDLKSWPGPVISLFLGAIAPGALVEAASSPNAENQRNQLCDAHFFLGEYELVQTHKKEAIERFQAAMETCRRTNIQYKVAKAEQKLPGQ